MTEDHRLRRVRELVRLVEEEGLEQLEVGDAEFWVKVVGQPWVPEGPTVALAEEPTAAPEAGSVAGAVSGATGPEGEQAEFAAEDLARSPMNGVLYAAPTPGADPYVSVGDFVEVGQVLCIIEAMKTFNEVCAEWAGTVAAVLVENEQAVKEGEPLMVIAREEQGQ
jgi:acetyl-CoA carboxylase biotin carboxyl carrier protein